MSLSRLRWGLAGLLALVGLISAFSALRSYAEHGLALGIAAVLVLAVITVAGMASLGVARKRIDRELNGLDAKTPSGSLYEERKQRLEAIKASGAKPDMHALAEASAAKEASRAYLGRYLVATTVLVGLVGTFAGLMETLGKVAPLLADDGGGKSLSLLAAPLAGLHVTFGASLVAIVVTLALSLAQGDLVLHEERALATLEDLTHHQLLPLLWPPDRDANERTVRVLEGLHTEIAQAVAGALSQATLALNKSQGERLATLAKELSSGARQTAEAVSSHTTSTVAELAKTSNQIEERLRLLTEGVSASLTEATKRQVSQMTDAVAAVSSSVGKSADNIVKSLAKQLEVSAAAATKRAEESALASSMVAEQMGEQLQKVLATAEAQLQKAAENNTQLAARLLLEAQSERKALADDVSAALHTLVATVNETATATVERTGQAVADSAKALSDTLAPLFTAESEERKLLASTLAQNLSELHTLVSRADDVSSALGAQAQNTSAALAEAGQKVVDALSATTKSQADLLAQSTGHTADALQKLSHEVAKQLTETNSGVLERLSASVQNTQTVLAETSRGVLSGLTANLESTQKLLGESSRSVSDGFNTLATRTETALAETNKVLAQSAETMVTHAGSALVQASHGVIESLGTMAARTESLLTGLGQQSAAAAELAVKGHAEILHATAATVVAGLGDTMLRSGERLENAATKLGDATRNMHATLEPLQPRLDALTAELERLTHEIAVMAAHADSAHSSAMVMAELERMGDGLERLASLVRLSREPESREIQEAHS